MIRSADILSAKILIVDDQEANVLLLERLLRGASYAAITSTTDPRQVCELHRQNRYDLILLDLQMPGLDGFQVMDGLKEIETEGYLPVLVITAQPEHKLRALNAGARDFVSKPFDLAEVLLRVRNMVEVRLLHLEAKKLHAQVVAEHQVSERLLLNVLRIGIDSGVVVARVIGKTKFSYDVWGETVNTARHMEIYGAPGSIQVNESTHARLLDRYLFEERGEFYVKDKGELKTYFLKGRKPALAPKLISPG